MLLFFPSIYSLNLQIEMQRQCVDDQTEFYFHFISELMRIVMVRHSVTKVFQIQVRTNIHTHTYTSSSCLSRLMQNIHCQDFCHYVSHVNINYSKFLLINTDERCVNLHLSTSTPKILVRRKKK